MEEHRGCTEKSVTRYYNFDLRSFSLLAFNFNSTAMLLNNFLRVRHAEAEPTTLRRIEWLEDLFDPLRTHSCARVFDRHAYLPPVAAG